MKEDHRSYRPNFCGCEKKAWKKKTFWSLYGIGILNLCDTGAALDQLSQQANREQVVNQFNDLLPVGLLAQLVRALHRYPRGQGFESRTSLNFFL